jgi:hypothetical protein
MEWAGDKRSLLHPMGKAGMILFSFHTQLYYVRTPPLPPQPRPPRHACIIVPRHLKRLNELIARYALANVGLFDADLTTAGQSCTGGLDGQHTARPVAAEV